MSVDSRFHGNDRKLMKFKNKKIQLIIFVGLIIIIGLFYNFNIQSVNAAYKWIPMQEIPTTSGSQSPTTFGGYTVAIYEFLLSMVGIVAMVMIIIGGFRYMTSTGNASAMADAKDMIFNALLGLGLALLSWLILYTINPDLITVPTVGF
jgi:hypothetical protein